MKIIVVGALPSSLINFRGELLKKLISQGHQVIAMGSGASAEDVANVEALGAQYLDYPVERNGLNLLADIKTWLSLSKIFRTEKPDVVLAYTIKPVIWGGLAALLSRRTKFYGLITGLGFAFQRGGFKKNLLTSGVKSLYRLALSKAQGVIFQNPDNLKVFVDNKIISLSKCHRVYGSGVSLSHYQKAALPQSNPTFLTIARLLGDKGLREYAQAAKIVKEKYPQAVFQLLGPPDPSPDGISLDEVKSWQDGGYIEYLGESSDVRPFINQCHIYVLASYHEGMPRTVLEAMAIGRPILTTNVPGCKETVIKGENGFLVEKQSVAQLADRMMWFIENKEQWFPMAERSYDIAKEQFDVHKVNSQLFEIMKLS